MGTQLKTYRCRALGNYGTIKKVCITPIWLLESLNFNMMLSISCLLNNFTRSRAKLCVPSIFPVTFSRSNDYFTSCPDLSPQLVLIIWLCVLLRQFFLFCSESFSFHSALLWPASMYSPHLAKSCWRETLCLEINVSANMSYTELLPALLICILQFSVPWWPIQLSYFKMLADSLCWNDWPLKILSPNSWRM